ncbi:hypothetical protein BGZ65_012969 [Modicella reniformis]|uniref:Uncharacterized protein n=1 Tax=Modicella reniformis TaxID=1440133 RepID=A0A9P6MJU7_9FUNG|nr:hypothetical protein BGZ65_012969 [Modicella reniformis]
MPENCYCLSDDDEMVAAPAEGEAESGDSSAWVLVLGSVDEDEDIDSEGSMIVGIEGSVAEISLKDGRGEGDVGRDIVAGDTVSIVAVLGNTKGAKYVGGFEPSR